MKNNIGYQRKAAFLVSLIIKNMKHKAQQYNKISEYRRKSQALY